MRDEINYLNNSEAVVQCCAPRPVAIPVCALILPGLQLRSVDKDEFVAVKE